MNHIMRYVRNDKDYMPEMIDIGDPSWHYIPVGFAGINTPATKEKPAGVVGWFRFKKLYKLH